ncbi:MAG: polysaccharide biosynthesis tyrosine autokinase [Actinobacteria bacterium]|nr:polysaccharide biosynthesis tyrosine autokinase [Actinomycetota bacterium]
MTEETIELQDFLKVINKYKWLIIFGALVCLISALIVTAYVEPIYEASLQLLVRHKQIVIGGGSSTAGDAYQAVLMSERLAKTFSQMIQNRSTAEKVVEKLGIPIPPIELIKKVKAEPIRDTQLIKVTVQDEDPAQAQLIANTIGAVFERIVNEIERDNRNPDSTQPLVSISVVDPALEPVSPVKPKPLLNAALALFVGLIASTGLAFLLSYLDMTIKEASEAEQLSGLVSLGYIPTIKKIKDQLIVQAEPQSFAAEAFRTLRTNIQYINFESSVKAMIVASPGTGEGKTLFSANIAAVMAGAGHKVLLVDCDLRRPRLHQIFGISNEAGIANILIGTSSTDKAIQETGIKDLDIVTSGPTPPNPVDLLESVRMEQFLEDVKQRYDFIIIDSPPISTVTDVLVLVAHTDGVIMLARHGETNRKAFINAKAALDKVNARILGFALNATKSTHTYGYYEYSHKTYGEGASAGRSKKVWAKALFTVLLIAGTVLALDAIVDIGVAKKIFSVFFAESLTSLRFRY